MYFSAFLGRIVRNVSFGKYDYNNAAKRNPDIEVSLSELENCISIGNTTEQQYDCQRHRKTYQRFSKKATGDKARDLYPPVLVLRQHFADFRKVRIQRKQGKIHADAYQK